MSTPAAPPAPREDQGGNVLQQRMGPFAVWVWLLIATVVIVGWSYLRSRKTTSQQTGQAAAGQTVPAQQVPDIIIQNQEEPGEGATPPPPGSVPPAPPPPTGGGGGTPKPPAKPPARPPGKKPQYKIVTVARWTENNTPWNSTLWGIAQHEGVKGGWQELARLNGIRNPRLIRAGQKIRVPA